MSGSRYTGVVFVDGKEFHNQLVGGVADNSKKKVFLSLVSMLHEYVVPKWMAEHNVEFHITDRETGKTEVI